GLAKDGGSGGRVSLDRLRLRLGLARAPDGPPVLRDQGRAPAARVPSLALSVSRAWLAFVTTALCTGQSGLHSSEGGSVVADDPLNGCEEITDDADLARLATAVRPVRATGQGCAVVASGTGRDTAVGQHVAATPPGMRVRAGGGWGETTRSPRPESR